MQLDLSKSELALLDEALKCWQASPHSESMCVTLISVMLGGKNQNKEQMESQVKAAQREAEAIVRERERKALLLRAKLLQAENRQSEHDQ
jgi:hypothetical protein